MNRIFLLSLLCYSCPLLCQDGNTSSHQVEVVVDARSVIDIEGDKDVQLELRNTTNTAGLSIGLNNTPFNIWLNYSAVKSSPSSSHSIRVSSDKEILGVNLYVRVRSATGSGKGELGVTQNIPYRISKKPTFVITNIGTAYTGDGVGNGHKLTYEATLDKVSYQDLTQGSTRVVITYTIIED